jgi:hypothetical protein
MWTLSAATFASRQNRESSLRVKNCQLGGSDYFFLYFSSCVCEKHRHFIVNLSEANRFRVTALPKEKETKYPPTCLPASSLFNPKNFSNLNYLGHITPIAHNYCLKA